ncbi:hypothetical protein [Microbacterium sp. P5_E9]
MALIDVARRRGAWAALIVGVVAALALAACSNGQPVAAPAESASPPPAEAVPGWPSAIAAIGHSGLTGYDSAAPGVDARSNSWATGDSPDVNSVYLRILAENPAVEGHAVNVAVDGSNVNGLLGQAKLIVGEDPKPELVLIQSIDNDMQCDGTDEQHLPVYRDGLVKVMDVLSAGLPDATILFVSQWASVEEYTAAAMAVDPARIAGTGLCDVVDPATLEVVPEKVAGLQQLVDSYFNTVVGVCSAYAHCITDEGAMQAMQLDPVDLTPDFSHLRPSGHAKMAEIAWDALYPN